jgi:hypothetical protein
MSIVVSPAPAPLFDETLRLARPEAVRKTRWVKKEKVAKSCIVCGASFLTAKPTQHKTCGEACKNRRELDLRAAWKRDNREAMRAYQRAWTERNPTAQRDKKRAWRARHPEKNKEHNRWRTVRAFGLTIGDYHALLAAQGGTCAICGSIDPRNGKGRFAVDHDHHTGKVRGLLCMHCNAALGLLGDDPARLRAAADYLEHAARVVEFETRLSALLGLRAGGHEILKAVAAAALATHDMIDREFGAGLVGRAAVDARASVAHEDRETPGQGEGGRHAWLVRAGGPHAASARPADRAASTTCAEASSTRTAGSRNQRAGHARRGSSATERATKTGRPERTLSAT